MEITDIKVQVNEYRESFKKADVSIVLDDALVLTELEIIKGQLGLFVSYPSYKNKITNIIYFKSTALRKKIQNAILKEYVKVLSYIPARN